jgi:hypothetical protein
MTEKTYIDLEYQGEKSQIDLIKERNAIVELIKENWYVKTKSDKVILEEVVDNVLMMGIAHGISREEKELQKTNRGPEFITIPDFNHSYEGMVNKVTQTAIRQWLKSAELYDHELKSHQNNEFTPLVLKGNMDLGTLLHPITVKYQQETMEYSPLKTLVEGIFRQGTCIGELTVKEKYFGRL